MMSEQYRASIHTICTNAGIPGIADRLANAGVSGNTLEHAIARNRGAVNMEAAVLNDEWLSRQIAHGESADQSPARGAATPKSSPRNTPAGNHGWDKAFAKATSSASSQPASSGDHGWDKAFANVEGG